MTPPVLMATRSESRLLWPSWYNLDIILVCHFPRA